MQSIKTEHLSYIYSPGTPFEKTAVDDVSLEIEQGDFVGVIGHTGSGKSTLIQHLNGLLKPSAGKIYINGQDIWAKDVKLRDVRFQVGLVFQYPEYQLFEETVYKDIAFGPKNMGLDEKEIENRVQEAAAFVGLGREMLQMSPFDLSGGQKRRVAIAGVIAMRPSILILDEPAAGLDPRGRNKVLDQIARYHEQEKNTVLLVSHSMEDVAKYARHVLVMNESKVAMFGTVSEIFSRAEELVAMRLSVPQVTRVFLDLKKRGYNLPGDVYTVKYAAEQILRLLGTKGGPA